MRATTIGLVLGLALAGCSDGDGPSPEGTLVIATVTRGDDPDPDGYLVMVDALDSLSLAPTGTAKRQLSAGRHTLRLLGVAEWCSVSPGDSLELDVPTQDTASVEFEIQCLANPGSPGFVRIIAATTGDAIPASARYRVSSEHFGAWDYDGGPWLPLGAMDANDTLVAAVAASSHSGANPYWYLFHLDVPGPCGYVDPRPTPRAPGFIVAPADTLDIEFAVICTSESPW